MTQKQTCILVLGMHRSGTSAIGGILSLLKISMGRELMSATIDNQKGYFENKKIYEFNDFELLPFLKSSWDDLSYLPNGWHNNKNLNFLYEKAKKIILEEYLSEKLFAIKDPRISFLFPFWEKILLELDINIKIIIALRNPNEIAGSLFKRDGFKAEKSLTLWSKHTLYSEYYSRKYNRIFIYYEKLLSSPEKTIDDISEILRLDKIVKLNKKSFELETFIETSLRHNKAKEDIDSNVPIFIKDTVKNINYLSQNRNKKNSFKKLNHALKIYQEHADFLIDLEEKEKILKLYNSSKKEYNLQHKRIEEIDSKIRYNNQDFKDLFQAILYINTGNGFNENETIKISYTLDSNLSFEYDLKEFNNIRDIRFDPVHYACHFKIEYFLINGKVINNIVHNGFIYDKKISFLHNDPQLIVSNINTPIDKIKIFIKKFELIDDIFSLRLEFKDKSIKFKNAHIEKFKKELKELNSRILKNQEELDLKDKKLKERELIILDNQKELDLKDKELKERELIILDNQKELQFRNNVIAKKDLQILENQNKIKDIISLMDEQNKIKELEKLKLDQKEMEIVELKELAQSMRIKNRVKRAINIKSLFVKKNGKSKNEKNS